MKSVYLRVALYIISTLLGLIPAAWAGLGVTYDPGAGVLVVNVEALVTAIFAGSALSAGIFARWGVR